ARRWTARRHMDVGRETRPRQRAKSSQGRRDAPGRSEGPCSFEKRTGKPREGIAVEYGALADGVRGSPAMRVDRLAPRRGLRVTMARDQRGMKLPAPLGEQNRPLDATARQGRKRPSARIAEVA